MFSSPLAALDFFFGARFLVTLEAPVLVPLPTEFSTFSFFARGLAVLAFGLAVEAFLVVGAFFVVALVAFFGAAFLAALGLVSFVSFSF